MGYHNRNHFLIHYSILSAPVLLFNDWRYQLYVQTFQHLNISEEASLSCEFEDEFLCGYMNSSLTPWTWVHYSDTSYQSAVPNKTGIKSNSNQSVNFAEQFEICFVFTKYCLIRKSLNMMHNYVFSYDGTEMNDIFSHPFVNFRYFYIFLIILFELYKKHPWVMGCKLIQMNGECRNGNAWEEQL